MNLAQKLSLIMSGGAWTPRAWSDAIILDASTITGLADGAAVNSWVGVNGTATGGAVKPVYKTGILGARPCVRFSGAFGCNAAMTVTASDEWTVAVVAKINANTDYGRIVGVGDFATLYSVANATYGDQIAVGYFGTDAFGVLQPSPDWDGVPWSQMMFTYTTSAAHVFFDGADLVTGTTRAEPSEATTIYLGGLAANNFLACDIAYLIAVPRVLDAADRAKLVTYLRNYMASNYVLFDGDSRLDTVAPDYVQVGKIMALLGSTYTATSYAISGQTVATINTNKAVPIARYSANRRTNTAVLWAGINDIYVESDSAANILANISTYCTAMQAAGYRMVVGTVLTRAYMDAGQIAVYNAVNASILANWATYADKMFDVTADARLQDPLDTDYFADGVHLTLAGQDIVAALIAEAIA